MTTRCLHPTCRCLLLSMLFADRTLSGLRLPIPPHLFPPCLSSPEGYTQKEPSPPRSVCMVTPTRFFSSSLHLVSDCDRGGLRLAPFSETSRSRQWKEWGRPQGRALGPSATDLHRGMTAGSKEHVACPGEPMLVPEVVQTPQCSPHTFL